MEPTQTLPAGVVPQQPTYAARILTGIADALDEHPTFTLSAYQLTCALQASTELLRRELPAVVVTSAEERALAAMPKSAKGQTAGEYAVILRDAAKGL